MSQWGFYFDQTRCIACKACTLACKAWNDDRRGDKDINVNLSWLGTTMYDNPDDYEYLDGTYEGNRINYAEFRKYHMKEDWIKVTTTEYGDVPPNVDTQNVAIACNHCDDPACVPVCPPQIIYKEPEFGAVLVSDFDACISCGFCVDACPWDAPKFYDPNYKDYAQNDPARPKMTMCTMCLDRIREGLKPACVAGCPNRALDAGPMDELKTLHSEWTASIDEFASDAWSFEGQSGNTGPNIIFKKRTSYLT